MKLYIGCKVCRGFLKPEEQQRGTCQKCEEAITKLVNEKLTKRVVGWHR